MSSSIATVTDSGMVSALAPGRAVISASSEGVSGQASMDVVAPTPAPVASVSVALGASSLNPGQTTQATATTRDANNNVLTGRTVSWGSSNTGVATVSSSGVVTAVTVGSAQITGTSEGQSGSATITVTSAPPVPVASVSVSLAASSLTAGQTTQATATTRDANNNVLTGRTVSWSTSNGGIATVSGSGLVTAVAAGTAQITATSEGQSGSATITVTVPPVASVSVSLAASSLNVGQTTQATATTRDANNNVLTGRSISWSTSNGGVATVSGSGVVTAVAAGTAQITATSEGQTGSATITITVPAPAPVASVSVSLAASTLNIGQTTQATATTRDANNNVLTGRTINWSTSNAAVATVSGSGVVTAVAAGTAQITATSEGQNGSASLTVNAPPPPPAPVARVSVSLSATTLYAGQTTQATATTYDANNNVLTGRVISWSSGNTSLATVSISGLVTAVAVGSVQITATSEGQSGSAGLTVSAPPPPPPPGSSNEPSGMTLISERPFNALQEDPTWDTDTSLSIFADATAIKSAPNVLRFTYPTGYSSGGSSPGHAGRPIGSYRVLYISYWGKLSANWYGHDSGVNKQLYAWTGGNPSFYMNARGVASGPLVPEVTFQSTAQDPGQGLYLPNLVPSAVIQRGVWYHMEIVLAGNTAGNSDGTFDWWLDGVHVGSYSGYRYSSGTATWNTFTFSPVWGGVGGPNVPATMTFDVDHVYLSGKN